MVLTESMEDYLEMIYRISRQRGYVRQVELAQALNVQPSSVTRMIQKLDEAGMVIYEKYRHISLTQRGRSIGRFLVWRDHMLKQFLQLIRTPAAIEEQVEGIEHYITPVTMCLIRDLVVFFRSNPKYFMALERQRRSPSYPEGEKFEELRAWLFRHADAP
ncbi:MAG TPA: transcriptional regulator MntR [Firmicutes bacterium]|nr:transcriptional regulator MntR [Bacillota bacterium]